MGEEINDALMEYQNQLLQVNEALLVTQDEQDRSNLLSLKNDLQQLIDLTKEEEAGSSSSSRNNEVKVDEYALFMAEMQKEGAIEAEPNQTLLANNEDVDLSSLEGTKCRAPHTHTWGDTILHNALITTVLPQTSTNDIKVKVLFINPTHKEMLPCPYYLDTECKFSDEKCHYSHGEVVEFSSLSDYEEPDFAGLEVGSVVFAKQSDKLWHRATVKSILNKKEICILRLDKDRNDVEVAFSDLVPAHESQVHEHTSEQSDDSECDYDEEARQDFINISLMITPTDERLGSWEKYTRGIGSKLMEKMGYVIGNGLGRRAEGRVEPVTAVALPAGKSLDHCMELREKSGGDENLFNVERKLKRLQRKQEQRNMRNYERESKKVDVFNFLNDTLSKNIAEVDVPLAKSQHRKEIKKESNRNLNVESFKIEKCIREIQGEIVKIREAMQRHVGSPTTLHKQLQGKLKAKQDELLALQTKSVNIQNEQSLRNTTRKLTVF